MSRKGDAIGAIHDVDDPRDLREIAQTARDRAKRIAFRRFHEGQQVMFRPNKGRAAGCLVTGTVKSVNRKTVSVDNLEAVEGEPDGPLGYGYYYRIHPTSEWWETVGVEGEEAAT